MRRHSKLRSHFCQASSAPNESGSFVTEPDHLVMIQLSLCRFSEHNLDGSVYHYIAPTLHLHSHQHPQPPNLQGIQNTAQQGHVQNVLRSFFRMRINITFIRYHSNIPTVLVYCRNVFKWCFRYENRIPFKKRSISTKTKSNLALVTFKLRYIKVAAIRAEKSENERKIYIT